MMRQEINLEKLTEASNARLNWGHRKPWKGFWWFFFFFSSFFPFFMFYFIGLHLLSSQEVPRLRVESELQLPASTTAIDSNARSKPPL